MILFYIMIGILIMFPLYIGFRILFASKYTKTVDLIEHLEMKIRTYKSKMYRAEDRIKVLNDYLPILLDQQKFKDNYKG